MRLRNFTTMLIFCSLFLVSCQHSQPSNDDTNLSTIRDTNLEERSASTSLFGKQSLLPIKLEEQSFHSVADWKDDETIFYITQSSEGSIIHTYHLFTGEDNVFYESDAPIIKLEANEDHSLFLVHTSPTSYEAELIILDEDANETFYQKIPSFELQYTWNQTNSNQLYVTSFSEDWSFNTMIIDLDNGTVSENSISVPFVQWMNEKQFSYLKWNEEEPSLSAPLYIYDLNNEKETLLSENIISHHSYRDTMITIERSEQSNNKGIYRFYDLTTTTEVAKLETPLLSLFSEWLIPYYDYSDVGGIFYTLQANDTGTTFDLNSFNIEKSETKTILNEIENLPFKLSPSGEFALYGARFEKVIIIEDVEIKELVELS
ncbi:hypothetical protein ACFFIX_00770 [Metabacillus herbersteinensis]|uniref:YqgU-like 6-bladed beta-propeller domain-containing protein n=1 Tax=Metabacillus herbersteinensis TaxID=283816 RepID=A0ABV6G9C7_9BACI